MINGFFFRFCLFVFGLSNPSGFISGVHVPVMDGLEATRDVRLSGREDGGSVPIITMTGNVSDGESRQSIQSGMNGRLSISHEGCPGSSCPALSCRFFRLILSLAGYP